jgi:2-methylcitrate dehydratase PrpD
VEPYSQSIGRFAGGLRLTAVPQAVVEKAKLVFLDTLGIALASSTMDFGAMVTNVARRLGGPSASLLIGTSSRVGAANAVIANGTLAHGLDYDDTLEEAIVHTGCCAGMTALAVGEEVGASGAAVLEAAIAGTEVLCKVGLVAPGKIPRPGFSSDGNLLDVWRCCRSGKTIWFDA